MLGANPTNTPRVFLGQGWRVYYGPKTINYRTGLAKTTVAEGIKDCHHHL